MVIFAVSLAISLTLSFWTTVKILELREKASILKIFERGKYLIIFQNNTEMRPTGGFIGSFATVQFKDYKVEKIDFNTNIYKLDNAFIQNNQIDTPAPLADISHNHWSLHDANFAVDYPQASKDIEWFYEQENKALSNEQETKALSNEQENKALSNKEETGDQVDGVMAINASLIKDLLTQTGPVYLPSYDLNVSADNFYTALAQKIEKEYFNDATKQIENEPKTILKDLMPILMDKAIGLPKQKLLKLVLTALDEKQILVQSNDPKIEQAVLGSGWGGEIQETNGDYLSINNANITDLTQQKNGGAKTSLSIKEKINYRVDNFDGKLTANLILTRTHTGSYNWPDGVNINWTRILVPLGSTLMKAELNGEDITKKIEVTTESQKTTFGLWINTAPQTSNVLSISYSLPFSLGPKGNYSLLVQKQPGNIGDSLTATLDNKVLYNGFFNKDLTIRN